MKWTFDPSHSTIEVTAKHMMITTVRGRFGRFAGEIEYVPHRPLEARARLEIDAASVDTGDPKRDAHLRSPDFLDVERYPKIVFETRRIERRGHDFVVTGDLTIRDVTQPVDVTVDVSDVVDDPWGGKRVAFEAEATIDRRKWGLVWNLPLANGGILVSNELVVHASIQAVPAQGAAAEEVEEVVEEAEEAASA